VKDRSWRCVTALAAAAVLLAFLAWMLLLPQGEPPTVVLSDSVTVTASAFAGMACARTGLRSQGRLRRGWLLLGAGMLSWSLGELIWAYYEIVLGHAVPFPSLADIGYLGMVPLALLGTASLATVARGALRAVLDGLIISGSLLYVSWATVLGPTSGATGQSWLAGLVSLAHPIGDVVTASVVFVLLSQADPQRRTPLVLVGAGLLSLAVADSGFAYLVQSGEHSSGNLIDTAWVGGFLLVGLAALWATDRRVEPPRSRRMMRGQLVLPYVPLAVALVTAIVLYIVDGTVGLFLYVNGAVLVLLVVVRQLVMLRDNLVLNRRLAATVDDLRGREQQLRELAFHDQLTGLANRALFYDRVEHAITRQPRDRALLAVLYIDLDGFKPLNDSLGHAAGDAMLVAVGQRLQACVRRGDTVARLGGDEFAVLLEDVANKSDAAIMAARITDLLSAPLTIDGRQARVSASVGVALHEAGTGHVGELLRDADIAMYGAKLQGKGRYVVFEPRMRTGIAGAPVLRSR